MLMAWAGTAENFTWIALCILLLGGGAGLHLWWRRRHAEASEQTQQTQNRLNQAREEHDRALTQARAQQQALFDSMLEGVVLMDAQDRIVLANESAKRLLDFAGELKGLTVLEAFRRHEFADLISRASLAGRVLGYEIELAGSPPRFLHVNASAILDEAKQRQGVILVLHDLTRLKELENTRQEFVANVSHELRTPLSLIKGYVETLIDGAKDDPVVAPRFLQTIGKHADRLAYLIEDLLNLSQLESGQARLNLQRLEVAPAADQVLQDLQARAGDKQVSLVSTVPQGLWIQADAGRFQQVLFNLVDNAIKYGRPKGRVELSARRLDDAHVEVCVLDDGPGIPAEATERVFERFYRVDRGRSREQGGTGLGLSIVKHIVQSHGGEVWVKSELGKGAAFYFTLPQA